MERAPCWTLDAQHQRRLGATLVRADGVGAPSIGGAVLAAVRGWSGGIVAVLSPKESLLVTRMRELGGFEQSTESSAFKVMMRGVRRSPAELKAAHGRLNSARSAFGEFAANRSEWTAEVGPTGVAVLRSAGAGFCRGVLQRRLSEAIEGRELSSLMAQTVRSATGAKGWRSRPSRPVQSDWSKSRTRKGCV